MNGVQFVVETHRSGFQKKDQGEDGDSQKKKMIFTFESLCHKPSI